jgi:hypothetical protein
MGEVAQCIYYFMLKYAIKYVNFNHSYGIYNPYNTLNEYGENRKEINQQRRPVGMSNIQPPDINGFFIFCKKDVVIPDFPGYEQEYKIKYIKDSDAQSGNLRLIGQNMFNSICTKWIKWIE